MAGGGMYVGQSKACCSYSVLCLERVQNPRAEGWYSVIVRSLSCLLSIHASWQNPLDPGTGRVGIVWGFVLSVPLH